MKTYTVTFNNCNDSRTVIEGVDFKTALSVYDDTKRHQRFFQENLNKQEKNSGIVTLSHELTGEKVYESKCRQVRK